MKRCWLGIGFEAALAAGPWRPASMEYRTQRFGTVCVT
jgi:hypothetical protein